MKSVQVFVIVAENRSFRKAAEILNRSQSAVSTQVKILEERVGVPLLHRTTRQVELTAEGEQLLVHAQRAMAALDFGLHQIADSAEIKTGAGINRLCAEYSCYDIANHSCRVPGKSGLASNSSFMNWTQDSC